MRLALLAVWLLPCCAQSPPDLNEVLRRVGENQEKAVDARTSIVYTQETRTRLFRGNSKLAREEHRIYTVLPTPDGTDKHLEKFEGRYMHKGKTAAYGDPKFEHSDIDIDAELVRDLTDDLVNDKKSRDGISPDLFPLTAAEQEHYDFQLAGTQKVGQVEALKLTFTPKKGSEDEHPWAGEALVDPVEYQPIRVTTRMAYRIPLAVKVLLGTNIRQLGFTLTCRKVADELWFPVSYGTEFHLRVLFGYARTVTMSIDNRDFRRASADSTIHFENEPAKP
ncbi:MAG: hypothetical protein ACLQBJ_15310 [Bryobacteraceae bacterium]